MEDTGSWGSICGALCLTDTTIQIESTGNRQPGNQSSGKLARLMTKGLGCWGDRDYEDDDMETTMSTTTLLGTARLLPFPQRRRLRIACRWPNLTQIHIRRSVTDWCGCRTTSAPSARSLHRSSPGGVTPMTRLGGTGVCDTRGQGAQVRWLRTASVSSCGGLPARASKQHDDHGSKRNTRPPREPSHGGQCDLSHADE